MNYRIALYIRASTEEQCTLDGTLKNQEERLKSEIKYRNQNQNFGEIVATFVDAGKSAKDMNRPELQKMLNAIKRKEINLIMVTELSRLSRSVRDFVTMNDYFRENGCKFVSMKDQYDTSTAGGEMVMLTMANLAQFERRQVSERVSANFKARAERGLYNGGQVPMGYKLIPEKKGYLETDSEIVPAIQKLFDVYLSQGTTSRAARWMNQNGYRMKRDTYGGGYRPRTGFFTFQNVHAILTNPVYIGIKRYKAGNEWKEVKACWDAIVDPMTYERVQHHMKMNVKRKRPDYPNRMPFLLSGLVFCSECKIAMVGKSANGNGGKVGYYDHGNQHRHFQCVDHKPGKCSHVRVQSKKLEEAVWTEIEKHFHNPKIVEKLIEDAKQTHKDSESKNEGAILKQKITHMKRRQEALTTRLGDLPANVSPEPIYELMRKTEGEIKGLELRASEVSTTSHQSDYPAELGSYQSFIQALCKLNHAVPDVKTRIMELLIHKIEITRAGFNIAFYSGSSEIERGLDELRPKDFSLTASSTVLTNGGNVDFGLESGSYTVF